MNQLTVGQRKMIYAGTAVVLLIPIILLGAPASKSGGGTPAWLAQSREKNDLGEASLGDVDPTSATMNLVLLGMRGVAASVLWSKADEYKDKKNFSQLEQTVESIILLQPHFKSVWRYQAWNLAYNVSNECDAVADRFYWVKRGAKFLQRGVARNRLVPELYFDMGTFVGNKLGNADEKQTYRKFFRVDPDEARWKGGPDEEINPKGEDNYLVARDWYERANKVLENKGVEQHTMDLALFLAYPYRSLMSYAQVMQKDGVQADLDSMTPEQVKTAYMEWAKTVRGAWDQAYDEWTNIYGRRKFASAGFGTLLLENDESGLKELAEIAKEENVTYEQKKEWQDRYRKLTSYPYWKLHCDIEKRETMTQARYHLAEGRRLYREVQDFDAARANLEQGLGELAQVVREYQVNAETNLVVSDEEEIIEEALKAIIIWRQVMELLGQPIPENYPLKELWVIPELQGQRDELQLRFQQWNGTL
ncbi:hypothetical protein [Planctomicrobium piriforme]|uniref:IRE (Iron responsive element) n=1 Tax=Planctomicrobium piriforme TaxID=1576369 RepID=A0A1I3HEK0_9PLAN|nr:hypothetical protein [Planctomicrobium piriforme]SFI34124.1 hypothetical protein SAMN05421753_10829 [Planctomicrobium piriforme]